MEREEREIVPTPRINRMLRQEIQKFLSTRQMNEQVSVKHRTRQQAQHCAELFTSPAIKKKILLVLHCVIYERESWKFIRWTRKELIQQDCSNTTKLEKKHSLVDRAPDMTIAKVLFITAHFGKEGISQKFPFAEGQILLMFCIYPVWLSEEVNLYSYCKTPTHNVWMIQNSTLASIPENVWCNCPTVSSCSTKHSVQPPLPFQRHYSWDNTNGHISIEASISCLQCTSSWKSIFRVAIWARDEKMILPFSN